MKQARDTAEEIREVAMSAVYVHYYKVWSRLVFTTIIPLIVLVFCNTGIFVTLRQRRDSMRSSSSPE